ncbi:MAG: hypothetical protein Kow0062_28900 [Acidobacteriota bacterium]
MSRARLVALLALGLALAGPGAAAPADEIEVDLPNDDDGLEIWQHENLALLRDVISCDLDDDGLLDLVVTDASAEPDAFRASSGAAYVFFGKRRRWVGPLDLPDAAEVVIYGRDAYDGLGYGLACGDIDGDGIDDLVLCADSADGPDGTRSFAGEAYIMPGRTSWPALYDLAVETPTVIYGEGKRVSGDANRFCRFMATGDFNGDGIDDLAIADTAAPDRTGTVDGAGRNYVLFGRTSWPQQIDLLVEPADVMIYGADKDGGIRPIGGDLDADGTDELLVTAWTADAPDGTEGVGATYVFHGRASWPPVIDLATDAGTADTVIWGVDQWDGFRAYECADIDGDGYEDVLLGAHYADGPLNDAPSTGEVRIHAGGPRPWPAEVNLATGSRSVIYGRDPGDFFGDLRLDAADLDGDGTVDLVVTADTADGPDNMIPEAGEVYGLRGAGPGLPVELDLHVSEAMLVIYGDDWYYKYTYHTGVADLNDDGLSEIAIPVDGAWSWGKIDLVSPFDVDGDGITQLPDNCPLVANADQADADGDGRGDACATDWDGDGVDDAGDCAPATSRGGPPGPVEGLRYSAGSTSEITWQAAAFADRYDVLRGDVAGLASGDYGACRTAEDPDPTDTVFDDPETPPAGTAWTWLVRARNDTCGLAGSWGTTSSGDERTNVNPAGCP